jgi:hypothetical protein
MRNAAPGHLVELASRILAPLVSFVVATGCSGACRGGKPYVPYSIDAGTAASTADDADAPQAPDASERASAQVLPAGSRTFVVEGARVEAAPERTISHVLAADLDGDGRKDVLAATAAPSAPVEIVLYRGKAGGFEPAVVAFASSSAVPCEAPIRMMQVGKRTVFVEVGSCGARGTRDIVALGFDRSAIRTRFAAKVTDEAALPKLTVEMDASDRDDDGIDDLSMRVALEGGGAPFEPGPKVSAQLKWLDRPAGMSREPDEPEASFRAVAATAAARATKPKEAATVPSLVLQLRALVRALCPESGSPRLARTAGADASCGSIRALEDAQLAAVRAYVTLGDPLRAIAALDRAQLPPATRTPARTTEAQAWILQAAPERVALSMRAVAAIPKVERGHAPAWGPLAFEPSGKLLVRTASQVVRVDPALGDESEADGIAPWGSTMASPDGAFQWIEAYDPCDAHAVEATFAPTGEGDAKQLALPVTPVGGRCTGKGVPVPVVPVAWGPIGLEAVVAGEPLLVSPDFARATPLVAWLDQPVRPGSPRSPSGKALVVPTSQGLFVKGANVRLYRAKELDGAYAELRGCTVSDDAAHVACVRAGRVVVGTWEP